jgi:Lon protease-like protein
MRLPHFPLHAVVFPHLPLPIHVFEERYRAMVGDAMAPDSQWAGRFVVSLILEGSEVAEGRNPRALGRAAAVGTIVEVRHAQRFADGRWVLLTVGLARVAIGRVDPSGPYAVVDVNELPEVQGDAIEAAALLPQVQGALDEYLSSVKRFVASAASVGRESQEITDVASTLDEVLKPIRLPDDPLAASYAVGGVLQIELTRKQRLLELPDAASRLRAELELLRREARLVAEGEMPTVGTDSLSYNPN